MEEHAEIYNKAFTEVENELKKYKHLNLENEEHYRRDEFADLFIPGRLKSNNKAFTIK